MANNINTKRIIQEIWPRALADYSAKHPRFAKEMSGPAGSVRVGRMEVGGIAATLADNATSASAVDLASFEATFTTAKKYIKHTVPTHVLANDTAFGDALVQLAGKTMANIDKDVFDLLAALFAANHPRVGTGVGQVGSGKYYLDTGLKGLQGESGEFTYANKIATDFGETGLDSAFQLLRGLKDDRGVPLNLGLQGDLVLVVNPADLKLAHEVTQSVLSGSDNASNFYRGLVSDIVDYAFTDADSWFLFAKSSSPMGYYLAEAPNVEIRPSDDGLFTHLVATYTGCPVYSPYEYGLVGSTGAG